ncbi:MAG: phosphatase PAP2 family protein [Stenotrophomonas sp.]
MFRPRHLLPALALCAALAACSSTPAAVSTDAPAPTGYLQGDAIPDSLALSPSPPAAGTAWAALDDAVAAQALALRDSPRFHQAQVDADLDFPGGAQQFSCALGIPVDERHTPALMRLLQRSLIDASASTRAAKQHYQRPRPFMLNGQPTCTPGQEQHMRGSGSYPSGHTAIGWAWALILSEIAPERATALLQRGRNYGHSRLVCNVHWYSDVQQGQVMAAATVARLHDDLQFSADLLLAQREIEATRALELPLPRDCAAEAAALEIDVAEAR